MQFLSLVLPTVLLSGPASWATPASETPLRVDQASIVPSEPSTLTLALIGIGTVAAYILLTQRVQRWHRATEAATGPTCDASKEASAADVVTQQPARGAA